MKSGILLLARMGSTRLPDKMLLEVLNRPILEFQIERLKTARRPGQIVLCTTPLPADDALVDLAVRNGLATFRGSAEDVVERMVQAARQYEIEFILSIGGDDVFSDPEYADAIIACFERTGADFIYCPGLPVGATPFGVKTQALEKLQAIKAGGTDGWERYFKEAGLFHVEVLQTIAPQHCRPELRMTLDYLEDFQFFKAVIEELYPRKKLFSLIDVITLIDQRPDIAALGQKRAGEWQMQHNTFDIRIKTPMDN